ncbi:MAG: ATP-binding cassette domain-containing protein [Berryella intestinalis]|uniref:ABC transporter ATP-binding protein n=1 Tax=Berryella intestinalis TaxID=1531429 RepID=UPI002A75F17C|nr:ATP-binding cassette domain-containing protein [Berryella intestinalis]MDY3128884.1 ATP-binding cassette domain-containing protein [Berryella intestinalis]
MGNILDIQGAGGHGSPAPFICIEDAVVRRAGRAILSIDSLKIGEGESVAIIGPNGSGKSTLVGLVARTVLPLHRDNPPVVFRGQPRITLSEIRSLVGVVSSAMQEETSVHLPALDIVAGGVEGTLGLRPRMGERDVAHARRVARGCMEQIGIADFAERDMLTLSTGQARRVLIARALAGNPTALCFDEPCTGLDPEGMHYVRRTMRRVIQAGRPVVLVTHYLDDIVPEVKRVIALKGGRVFADGPKEEILTDRLMSALFDLPVLVASTQGRYSLVTAY